MACYVLFKCLLKLPRCSYVHIDKYLSKSKVNSESPNIIRLDKVEVEAVLFIII